MARPSRNLIFQALFDLTKDLTFDGGRARFVKRGRKLVSFADLSSSQKPALFQCEPAETTTHRTGTPWKRTFEVSWVAYFSTGKNPNAVPTETANDILDALEAAVCPDDEDPEGRQTLGGLVYDVVVDGTTIKIAGDDDGEGMIVVPLKILVP